MIFSYSVYAPQNWMKQQNENFISKENIQSPIKINIDWK